MAAEESEIQALEAQIAELDSQIEAVASDFVKLKDLMEEKEQKEADLDAKMERWMYLNELAEKIEAENNKNK